MRAGAIVLSHGPLIAALPMYDFRHVEAATDRFWGAIAERLNELGLSEVPARLSRGGDYRATWRNPRLLFGQTCGYPLMKQLRGDVRIVATPVYDVPGCEEARHRSIFIVNAEAKCQTLRDLRGGVCAVNSLDSNSGFNLLRAAIAPLAQDKPFFCSVVLTGSHAASLEAVAARTADLAAIDCVSLAHLQRWRPDLGEGVRPIGQSALAPAPPFITSSQTDDATLAILRKALTDVADDPALEPTRAALMIAGFAFLAKADYVQILDIEQATAAAGCFAMT